MKYGQQQQRKPRKKVPNTGGGVPSKLTTKLEKNICGKLEHSQLLIRLPEHEEEHLNIHSVSYSSRSFHRLDLDRQ